ncbi:MAG: DMT family transporter [Leucobacter sp.]|nr:DMT family transporter [Leucobacter sp.]
MRGKAPKGRREIGGSVGRVTSAKTRLPVWLALLGSGIAGALVAVQSRINGGLSNELGNGYVTAAVSFGSGLILIAAALLVSGRARAGLRRVRAEVRSGHLPRWALTGGLFGAFFVLSQGLIATTLGLALFAVGIVAGQVLGGLLIDRIGLGPGGRVGLTAQRLIGTALAIVAVAVSVYADLAAPAGLTSQIWLILVPVAVGAGVAFQSAVNGLVRSAAYSATTATFVSFLVGAAVLIGAAAISVTTSGWPTVWPTEPWYYFGGVLGVIFIALAALLVRTAGVLLLSMSNVAGQLLASVAVEAALPLAGGVTTVLLAATGVALLAVVIAAIPSRR